jgi:hypothetical protein
LTPFPQNGAVIFINGSEAKNNLRVKGLLKKDYIIYNLLPQTYEIKVQKDGYWDWKKSLSVLPGIITYAQPLLLPRNPAANIVFNDKDIADWAFSPDYKKIAYLKGHGMSAIIGVYDITSQKTKSADIREILPKLSLPAESPKPASGAPDFSGDNAKIFWSPNSANFALIADAEPGRIFLFSANEIAYLAGILVPEAAVYGQWSESNDYFAYLTQKQELYSLSPKSSAAPKTAIANNISGFTIKNNDVYYLENKNLFIYRFPLSAPGTQKQLSFAPLNFDAGFDKNNHSNAEETPNRLIVSSLNDIAIIASDKSLFLIRRDGLPTRVGSNIESAEFSRDGKSLLYNSRFEIFTYSLESNSENLITRAAQKISNASWHKGYAHIWFYSANTLKNIELDSRPVPNIVDFLSLSQPAENFIYDNNAGNIYYDQADGNKISIYQVKE